MKSFVLGASSSGLPIPAYRFGTATGPGVLVLGGVHGDEPEGIEACLGLIQRWIAGFPFRFRVTIVPVLNIDGVLRSRRVNARGVDLNRNMATNDWSPEIASSAYHPGPAPNSEPETRALVRWLDDHRPVFVLSLHSWKPLLITNGSCQRQAAVIAKWIGYSIQDSVGFPTPGCLGTYCGRERDMPTLTYEIERGLKTSEILRLHVPAIEDGLKATESMRQKT
jgi:murein peptide amidase A